MDLLRCQFDPSHRWGSPPPSEVPLTVQTFHLLFVCFTLHFDDDTPNFSDFKAGTLLASEPGARYEAQQDGEAIVFPNANVAIGQRALLTVIPTTLETMDV